MNDLNHIPNCVINSTSKDPTLCISVFYDIDIELRATSILSIPAVKPYDLRITLTITKLILSTSNIKSTRFDDE